MSERYGTKVRWLRTGQRMSGRELCRRIAITPSYLSDIETGRRLPAPAVSDRIAAALGVDADDLWRLALLERLPERDLRVLTMPAEPRWPSGPDAERELAAALHEAAGTHSMPKFTRQICPGPHLHAKEVAAILAALQEKRDPGE